MRKLIITILVCTFVFGMAGMAKAALYTETFLGSASDSNVISLLSKKIPQDYATFMFDLAGSGGAARKDGSAVANSLTKDSSNFIPNSSISASSLTINFGAMKGGSTYLIELFDVSNSTISSTSFYSSTNYAGPINLAAIANYNNYLGDGSFLLKITNTANGKDKTININQVNLDVTAQTVPVPSATWLLGTGLIGMFAIRRRTRLA